MTIEEKEEIIKLFRENMDFYIPNATASEQNYYLRGVIDALMAVPNEMSDGEFKAITDARNRISSAEEEGKVIGVLIVVRSLLDSGIKIEEVANKYTDYSPDELERLLQDNADLIKERMEWQRQKREALAFEDDSTDGVFAVPNSEKVKVRKLSDYCKKVGKKPSELSAEELEQFSEE